MRPTRGTADAPDERSLVSARLLLDLVENTLDPGYAAAAARKEGRDSRRRWDHPIVALGCVLIGLLLVVAYVQTNRGAPQAQQVHDRLVQRVRTADAATERLTSELDRIERTLSSEQAQALPGSRELVRTLQQAKLDAGQVAVRGPGFEVRLTEPTVSSSASPAAARVGSTPITSAHILSDRDVRSVVNELWLDGAEAIAVNGIRLTPTSAIRFAGEAVLVDFQPIESPYVVQAVGDPDRLATSFAQSAVASRYQTLSGTAHLGFSFSDKTQIDLPASGPVTPRYASPDPSPSPSAARTGTR